jgi:class 3 adenylate cyclase
VTRECTICDILLLIAGENPVYTLCVENKKLLPLLISAICLTISLTAITAQSPTASDAFNYSGSGAVLLQGPWERYDGVARTETSTPASGERIMLPRLPLTPDFTAASSHETTYRIDIRIAAGDPARRMALYIPAYAGVAAVYANGALLYDKGQGPASPPLLLAEAPDGSLSLALRLDSGSRPLEAGSTFPSFVLFGDAESVSEAQLAAGIAAASMDGFFLLLGSFVFMLFLFWRKNREFLGFSIFLLAVGAGSLFMHSAFFAYAAPPQGRLEAARLAFIGLEILALTFLLHSLYPSRIKRALATALYAPPAVLTVAAFAASVLAGSGLPIRAALPPLYAAVEIYAAAFGAATCAFLIAFAAKGDMKARWLAPAFLALLAAFALSRFGPESLLVAFLAPLAGAVLFSALVFLLLIKRVADSFESSETLTDYVASVSRAVTSFIPREFLEHLEKTDLVDLRLGDHAKKEMTIFFSDIRAFTQLSEGLTVEENFAFINSYLSRVVPIIKENGGFVDKYVGDGIMALFPGPEGPDEAIRSAIAMQTKMVEYNGHRAKMGYKPISMGVGVHTGDLMLGVVGVEERMENTVISDAVNLSSRLQAITKAFNIGLAISEKAFKELADPGIYKYRFIGKVKVKGKAAPISVFEIFDGIEPGLFERKMKANMFFEQGMLSYYQKDFAGAMYYFKRVLEIIPEDGAAGFYLDNCMNRATL